VRYNHEALQDVPAFSQTFLLSFLQKATLLIFIFLIACSAPKGGEVVSIRVCQGWQFKEKSDTFWRKAIVPGSVHTDLLEHQLIPDPYFRGNEKKVQDIGKKEWEYKTTFEVDSQLFRKSHIQLVFHGLDTYAKVFLNNTHILTVDNMFRRWQVDIKPFVQVGDNQLYIHFLSPEAEVEKRWQEYGIELPGGSKVMARKPGYHFGWDWGPKLVTSGIWRAVEILAWNSARIDELQLVQESLSPEYAIVSAQFKVHSGIQEEALLSIAIDQTEKTKPLNSTRVQLMPGINTISFSFQIQNPRLWWSHGLGEAFLYNLKAVLKIKGRIIHRVKERIGLRTVEVVVKKDKLKDGTPGETFYFKLNGVPVFMKGANYIPQDNFVARVGEDKYRALIRSVVDANMNMLRVWGGGIYENDLFYDLCDENGILIWQDFMFACAMYPGDNEYIENIKQEAIDNVKRLRNHPSIALWCGNNEVAEGWHNWGWQKPFTADHGVQIWEDYQKIFHSILPQVVAEFDPNRYYWPSSPKFGRSSYRSLNEGDNHYWGVWHDAEPFSVFNTKIGRFMSEYGFQSFPAFETIRRFTVEEDWAYDSETMMVHQKHPRGNQLIQTYMARDYPKPHNFEEFVYLSQVLQAEGMRIAIESHRRAMPYCMGSLYWQLNDCWPVVSWSSIDYYGSWKALHYFAKRAYAPVLISPIEEQGKLKIYIVSDLLQPKKGIISLKLLDFSGNVLWQQEEPVTVKANTSASLFEMETQKLLQTYDKTGIVLTVQFKTENRIIASNLHYFVPPKQLELVDSGIESQISWSDDKGIMTITLNSKSLAKSVYLSIPDAKGFFSDNFFDLLPGQPITITFKPDNVDSTTNYADLKIARIKRSRIKKVKTKNAKLKN
jgi:beta-mannosidase